MAHTISAANGSGTTSPLAIDGYAPSRTSRNVIHDLLDGSIGVSYIAPRPRSGTLRLTYRTLPEAFAAFTLHGEETSFTLTSTVSQVGMSYALDGELSMPTLDPRSGMYVIEVGYQELTA
ncbi:hypothetical protein [Microbacterium sp. MTN4-26]|uniref:hypothetical protein n=1 Tax=unclassified Microbacterium TaxID=2609290 RepID=UPI0036F27EB3